MLSYGNPRDKGGDTFRVIIKKVNPEDKETQRKESTSTAPTLMLPKSFEPGITFLDVNGSEKVKRKGVMLHDGSTEPTPTAPMTAPGATKAREFRRARRRAGGRPVVVPGAEKDTEVNAREKTSTASTARKSATRARDGEYSDEEMEDNTTEQKSKPQGSWAAPVAPPPNAIKAEILQAGTPGLT